MALFDIINIPIKVVLNAGVTLDGDIWQYLVTLWVTGELGGYNCLLVGRAY